MTDETRVKAAHWIRRYRPVTVVSALAVLLLVGWYVRHIELRDAQQGRDIERITRTIQCQVSVDCREFVKQVAERVAAQQEKDTAKGEQPSNGAPESGPSPGASSPPGGSGSGDGSPGGGSGSPPGGGVDPGGSDPGGGGTDPGGGGTDPGSGGSDSGVDAGVCIGDTCVDVGVHHPAFPDVNPNVQIPLGPAGNLLP